MGADQSLGDFLEELGLRAAVRDKYILPFSGAIWRATPAEMSAFPAQTLVRFFKNHGLLSTTGQPAWRTVSGGSKTHVDILATALRAKGVTIRVCAPVDSIMQGDFPCVSVTGQPLEAFDAIVLACHSDQALRLLQDIDADQNRVLGALCYKANRAVLHNDPRQMPKRQECWSSWNYLGASGIEPSGIGVTY